jgi:hypothetical protein
MDSEDIDYFGFELRSTIESHDTVPYETSNEFFKNKVFLKTKKNHHLYSVQPTIWKKESLIKICNENEFTLHELDHSFKRDDIRKKYNFKCLNNSFNSFFNDLDIEQHDYFVIAYYELLRHGVFPTIENGFNASDNNEEYIKFIRKMIKEENLVDKEEFKNVINNIK